LIVGPLVQGLASLGDFAILLMPDHATPSKLRTHSPEPVPFALMTAADLAGSNRAQRRYTEAEGARSGLRIDDGCRLIAALFGRDRLAHRA
jgi:2,3-bisphosphoglycerate-independent phosphoglycerate mutase